MKKITVKLIVCLAFTVPFMSSAHTKITSNNGKNEIVLAPKLIEEHCPLINLSLNEFSLHNIQKVQATDPKISIMPMLFC